VPRAFENHYLNMNIRAFIGDRLSTEFRELCERVYVNPNLMSEQLINDIKVANEAIPVEAVAERIRVLFNQFQDRDFIKSHLAVLFEKSLSMISRIIRNPNVGRVQGGRPRLLTREQEDEIVAYIRNCQISGHCVTAAEVTTYCNMNILEGMQRISKKFIVNNNHIMENLDTAVPQAVEELRIEACYYENFVAFFDRLRQVYDAHPYDVDLIINVDETTTNAEKTKRSTKVLYDPAIDVRPMAKIQGKVEHITLCCAITASGKSLMPVFILKNKSISVEDEIIGTNFNCGSYGLMWSPNGWQDAVIIYEIIIYLI
jgi:hypothetical protein